MKLLKNNWKLKLLSLIVAIFLWSFVISEENPTVDVWFNDIPVVFENENTLTRKNLMLTDENRPKVNVQIRGHRNDIVNVTSQHIRVSTDLSKYEEGVHKLALKYDLPAGIEVATEAEPINVNIQAVITKDFRVKVDLNGAMPKEYILETAKTTPDNVTVKGPREAVESIDSIVAKLNAEKLTNDLVANVDIEALTKDGKVVDNIELGQKFVNINATVNKTKAVKLVVETENELPKETRLVGITADPDMFYIKGNSKAVDKISEIKTKKLDLSTIYETRKVDLELLLPTDVSLVDEELKFSARIDVEKMIEKTINVPSESIEITGVPKTDKVTFDKENFQVKIKGYEDDITDVLPEDLEATYSLLSSSKGKKSFKPTVTTKGNYTIESVESVNINIE